MDGENHLQGRACSKPPANWLKNLPSAAFAFNIFQNFGSCKAPINHWMPWAPLTALMTTNAFAMTNGAFGRSRGEGGGGGGRARLTRQTVYDSSAGHLRPSTELMRAFYGPPADLVLAFCGCSANRSL